MKTIHFVILFFLAVRSNAQITISRIDPFDFDTLSFSKRVHTFSKTCLREANDSVKLFKVRLASDSYFQTNENASLNYAINAGIDAELRSKRWYNRTQVLFGYGTFGDYIQTQPLFLAKNIAYLNWITLIKTRTAFRANRYLTLQAGIDNQFLGEGYRSLLQGDQVAPNPFAGIQVKFLNLEYGLNYQFLQEHDFIASTRKWKYLTSHYLSWNAFRNFNITLYECVIYQPKDGKYNRSYDVEYLNPFVFFRPQEYSLGSTDNVFLGINLSYRIQKQQVYFQLLLDEFDLGYIKNRSRWWANKYGVQLGVKGEITRKLKYRFEGNVVRPYTYSHITSGQNLGHMGLPLATYLGSNFAELLATIQLETKIINYQVYSTFYLKGNDVDGFSWGGNIYNSYVNRPFEYGHHIGQGSTVRFVAIGGMASYELPFLNWDLYVQGQCGYFWGDVNNRISSTLIIGVRSSLFNKRRLF